MDYFCIDTNILIYGVLDRGKDNYENILKIILDFLNNSKIKLLLPDIIEKEFFRNYVNISKNIETKLANFKTLLFNQPYPADIIEKKTPVINSIEKAIQEIKKFDQTKSKSMKLISEIFEHKNTIKINSSMNVLTKTYKRTLFKLKPNTENFFSGDNLIAESLIDYADSNSVKIYFLSRNYKDFGASKKSRNELHPELVEDFRDKVEYIFDIEKFMHEYDPTKKVNKLPEIDTTGAVTCICPRCKYIGSSKYQNVCPVCGFISDDF